MESLAKNFAKTTTVYFALILLWLVIVSVYNIATGGFAAEDVTLGITLAMILTNPLLIFAIMVQLYLKKTYRPTALIILTTCTTGIVCLFLAFINVFLAVFGWPYLWMIMYLVGYKIFTAD